MSEIVQGEFSTHRHTDVRDPEDPPREAGQIHQARGFTESAHRLAAEFGGIDPEHVLAVLVNCRRDLSGVPETAVPELVERLARQRLSEQAAHHGEWVTAQAV